MIQLHQGDALAVLATMPAESIDSIVTDPPYGLSREPDVAEVLRHWLSGDDYEHGGGGFMGKSWDSFVPGPAVWKECLRVLKPGGHLLCFAGSRTVDLMGMAVRLGGFEIRDQLQWLYGSGFPKSMDVAKAIDKNLGVEGFGGPKSAAHAGWIDRGRMRADEGHEGYQRPWMEDSEAVDRNAREYLPGSPEAEQWKGWGTALKPAHEPIILARKPLRVDGRKATVAKNVLTHGTGAINIDATRVDGGSRPLREWDYKETDNNVYVGRMDGSWRSSRAVGETTQGRWPANVILDPEAGALLDEQTGTLTSGKPAGGDGPHLAEAEEGVGGGAALEGSADGSLRSEGVEYHLYGDSGGASRFFYCAKTAKSERNAGLPVGLKNDHPTVKPVKLMEWLVKLVTPPGGTVLDPFCGSGTTLVAAERLGFDGIGVDRDDDDRYLVIAQHRVRHASELEYGAELPQPSPSPTTGAADDFGVVDLFPDA